jgi:hypothetical protein
MLGKTRAGEKRIVRLAKRGDLAEMLNQSIEDRHVFGTTQAAFRAYPDGYTYDEIVAALRFQAEAKA